MVNATKEKEWYSTNKHLFEKLASKVQSILIDILDENKIEYHIVSSRCKTIDSFSKKIENPKYNDRLEFTDLAGIRIITYVEDSIPLISKIINENFNVDDENSLDKSDDLGLDKVGYKSVHFVAQLPDSRILLTEYKKFKDLKFEIQVRTILQHSWAEIEHDRNYKFAGNLPSKIQRRFKLLAGLLELADNEFNSISREIDQYSKEVKDKTIKGDLEISINSTSLKQFLSQKFSDIPESAISQTLHDGKQIIEELETFGIKTLKELDKIIPTDLKQKYKDFKINTSFTGIVRDIMIINDYQKYFQSVYRGDWWFESSGDDFLILKKYNLKLNEIEKIIFNEDQVRALQEFNEEED